MMSNKEMSADEFGAVVEAFGECQASSGDLKLAIRRRADALDGEQREHFERAAKPFLEEAGGWSALKNLARISRGGLAGEPLFTLSVRETKDGRGRVRLALWKYRTTGEAEYATHILAKATDDAQWGHYYASERDGEDAVALIAENMGVAVRSITLEGARAFVEDAEAVGLGLRVSGPRDLVLNALTCAVFDAAARVERGY